MQDLNTDLQQALKDVLSGNAVTRRACLDKVWLVHSASNMTGKLCSTISATGALHMPQVSRVVS